MKFSGLQLRICLFIGKILGVGGIKMAFDNKIKFPLWVYPQTIENVRTHYKHDNCKSQSEFIEKAIAFYIGYLL